MTPSIVSATNAFAQDNANGGWVLYQGNENRDRSTYVWIGRTPESDEAGFCNLWSGGSTTTTAFFSGSNTATLEPMVFQITPSATTFSPGETLQFTLTLTGVTPVEDNLWQWVSSSGQPTNIPACTGQYTCDFAPPGNGTMEAIVADQFMLNAIRTFTQPITQNNCPPKDSILDIKMFRDSLKALLDDSNPDDTAVDNRIERAGALLRDRATGLYKFVRSAVDTTANNCKTKLDIEVDVTKYKLIALAHSHPYDLLKPVSKCGSFPNDKNYYPMGSVEDVNSLKDADQQVRPFQSERVREYIIDKQGVIRLEVTNPDNEKYFFHSKIGCKWYP